ncbi:tail assembly chaperone [Mycobacterium phage Thonko]|uniref:Tail assembly chaperone n=1 Tax=Mycobacterium phage Thonko TaxID=2282910 RepID=A0A346FC71_9CAUD|nr:tail assembly chaperone [Mycobacterium phage Thonko]AXN53296.1 tail assembly chaperone [Mycobacterium phage Thonko]
MAVTARITINEPALERESGTIIRRKHRSLTRRIATQARADVPVRTGNLGRMMEESPQVYRPFHVSGGVENKADYAAPVHEGSRPHVIRARNAQFLHFWSGGVEYFRRSVFHPGTRARPFLRNAAERIVALDPDIYRE